MIFFILILLMILIGSAKIAQPNQFADDYMSRDNTNIIKGIFVILILLGHASTYVKMEGVYDQPYMDLRQHLNQMVVAMFFFYSGYGMMKSILKKGFSYVKEIPLKRFLVVLINFDIAVCLFIAVHYFYGITFDFSTIALAFTGWTSVGNSNWYMFAIFAVYILLFVAFCLLRFCNKKVMYYIALIVFTAMVVGFVFWEIRMGQPNWCYNTVILFPLGCWYGILQDKIDKIVLKNDYIYAGVCMVAGILYWISFTNRWSGGIEKYTVWAVMFTLCIVLFTMKITIKSRFMLWLGNHVFSMYILQRIPMLILSRAGIATQNRYTFMVLTILSTIFIALIFDWLVGKLDTKIKKWRVL